MKSANSRGSGGGPARRLLITGAGGLLATAREVVASGRGLPFTALGIGRLDITDEAAVRSAFLDFAAGGAGGLVMNAAAYTNVEGAEDDPEGAYAVNEQGAGFLAAAAREAGLGFVHVSTDFVFDGETDRPYREDDAPNPLSVYGASKLAGERSVAAAYPGALIVRTAWVFGPPGPNFPSKILSLARTHPYLRVVEDEVGSPTYTVDLAGGILDLAAAGAGGLFHLTASGSCSRYRLACEVLRIVGIDVPVEPVSSKVFPTKVRRPQDSTLDCSRAAAMGVRLPDWKDGLARYLSGSAV
ncbi:MAG: dTDP-4-dehydrorhamnose reductase [Thermoleophilia bacterium]